MTYKPHKNTRDPSFLTLLYEQPGLTHESMAAQTGHSRSTAWRFCQRNLGRTIYISGWICRPEGGPPSPRYSLMVVGDEEDVPKPQPMDRDRYCKRVKNHRVRGVPPPPSDPVMAALMGVKPSSR